MSESGEPSASPTVRNHLVVDADLHTNSDYRLFTFVSQLPEEETARVPIICITEVEGQLLCAIPGTAWNRLVRLRILPPKSFLQATSVAVAAAELGARNLVSEGVFIRVWLGFLAAPFEECLEVFSEDLDRAFVTEDGDIGHLPFSDALLQVADEKFSFVSAMSGEPVEEASEVGVRVSKLEAGLQSVQATLQQLVQLQSPNPITQKTTAVLLPPKPKPAAVKDPLHGDGIAGLDASAVRAALDAGIPRAHLEQVSQLLLGRKPKFADAPGAKVEKKKPRLDVLGDTEDEAKVAEDAAPVPVPDPGVDPVGHALVKLTAIVDHLTVARKKPRSLEDTLDDSGLLQDSLSSSSSVGSSRKTCSGVPDASQGLERLTRRDLCHHREKDAGRFWVGRASPGSPFFLLWHLSRLVRAPLAGTEHSTISSDYVGSCWCSRCITCWAYWRRKGTFS